MSAVNQNTNVPNQGNATNRPSHAAIWMPRFCLMLLLQKFRLPRHQVLRDRYLRSKRWRGFENHFHESIHALQNSFRSKRTYSLANCNYFTEHRCHPLRLSSFESIDHRQQYDDSQEGCQDRGAVRVKVTIFFVVFDCFGANEVPVGTRVSRGYFYYV